MSNSSAPQLPQNLDDDADWSSNVSGDGRNESTATALGLFSNNITRMLAITREQVK